MNILCFILLATCLYGNDHMNRAMITKVNPQLLEVTNNLAITKQKLDSFEAAKNNVSKDASQLQSLIDEKGKQSGTDKTQVTAATTSLSKIISLWKDLKNAVDNSQQVLAGLKNLKEAQKSIDRIEFERWILVVTLLSIMFAVLFLGVLAVCKKSRNAVVAFSGLGLVVFFLSWVILSVILPFTIAYADFCETGKTYVSHYFPEGIYNVLSYYEKCVPENTYSENAQELNFNKIETYLEQIKEQDGILQSNTIKLFGQEKAVKSLVSDVSGITVKSLKDIGTINALASCSENHHRIKNVIHGFCHNGFFGNLLFLFANFFFSLFMGFLLMVASRSWFAYEKRGVDYTEVSEDDPFQRNDNSIPADIYGTHVFNPRTRYAGNSGDNNTESTGTNSAGHAIGEQNTPLLGHATWQHTQDMNNTARYC